MNHPPVSSVPDGGLPSPFWPARLALVALLCLPLWLGCLTLRPPSPQPASAPLSEFSAERAMVHLRAIATEPRPAGSEGNARARQYLVEQLEAMGLATEEQTAVASMRFPGADYFSAGTVHNVVARLPGSASTGTIVLDAHYDGGSTGPAAADNGAGVVTVLETVRAVLAGAPLANDIIVVFTDGEEDQDLGAVAFAEAHPWMADARLAINYEAQGIGGPAMPYITGPDNSDWLVSELLAAAPSPNAYSLLVTLSELLWAQRPGCDLHEYIDAGLPGIGFVFFGDTNAYHTVLDNVDRIDPGTIQQEGGYTLALLRRLGDRDLHLLPAGPDERIYFTIAPGVVASYPAGWAVGIAAAITATMLALLFAGWRRRVVTIGGALGATGAYLGGTILTIVLVTLLWAGVRLANPNYQVAMAGTYQTVLLTVALGLAAVAMVAALWALLRRRLRAADLTVGGLLVWALLLWVTSLGAPTVSYLFAWPLLFALLPLAWSVFAADRGPQVWMRPAVLALGAAPALLFLPVNLYQVLGWLNRFAVADLPSLGLVSLFVAPVAVLLAPQLEFLGEGGRSRHWGVAMVAAGGVVALLAFAVITSGFSAAKPRPDQIAYELNADTGQASWVSNDAHLDRWTATFIPVGTPRGQHATLPGRSVSAYSAPTLAVELAAPVAELLSDTTAGGARTLRLHLSAPRGATGLEVLLRTDGTIATADIGGKALHLGEYAPASEGSLELRYAGLGRDGADLTVTVPAGAPLDVALRDVSYGLPNVANLAIVARPADTMPALTSPRDATMVTKTYTF